MPKHGDRTSMKTAAPEGYFRPVTFDDEQVKPKLIICKKKIDEKETAAHNTPEQRRRRRSIERLKAMIKDDAELKTVSGSKYPTERRNSIHVELSNVKSSLVTSGSDVGNDMLCKMKKQVTFSEIVVRKYARTQLDNNPAVTSGPAIGLGGNFIDLDPVSVAEFEEGRGKRKQFEEMRLSDGERIARLIQSGYSVKSIQVGIAETRKAQQKRDKTVKNLDKATREEVMGNILSKLKDVVTLGRAEKLGVDIQLQTNTAKSA